MINYEDTTDLCCLSLYSCTAMSVSCTASTRARATSSATEASFSPLLRFATRRTC